MHSGTNNALEEKRTPLKGLAFKYHPGEGVGYINVKTGCYHIWVKKEGYRTVHRSFWINGSSAEVIKNLSKTHGPGHGSAPHVPATRQTRTSLCQRGRHGAQSDLNNRLGQRPRPMVPRSAFLSDFPNLRMSDDPRRRRTKDKRAKATWAGDTVEEYNLAIKGNAYINPWLMKLASGC